MLTKFLFQSKLFAAISEALDETETETISVEAVNKIVDAVKEEIAPEPEPAPAPVRKPRKKKDS